MDCVGQAEALSGAQVLTRAADVAASYIRRHLDLVAADDPLRGDLEALAGPPADLVAFEAAASS